MDKLFKKLQIDDTLTKPIKKDKVFTKIKDVITPIANYNYMADLLYLPNDKGYKYLLVVTDLITHAFDIEPLKNKESETVLQAMKTIFERSYLKKPYASLRTDNGTEFKNVFHKYLHDNDIFHSVALPYRHTQMSAVESLNKQLGTLFNGYMNAMSEETGKIYTGWTDAIEVIRNELNDIRYTKAQYTPKTIHKMFDSPVNLNKANKFNIDQLVHRRLDYPQNALGHNQSTANFRTGDYRFERNPRKVVKILYYTGKIPYRYMLEGLPNVSFTESQLMPSKEKKVKYVVKKIIGKKTMNKQIYYLVWWKGYPKEDATYELKHDLLVDDLSEYIRDYELEQRNKMIKVKSKHF